MYVHEPVDRYMKDLTGQVSHSATWSTYGFITNQPTTTSKMNTTTTSTKDQLRTLTSEFQESQTQLKRLINTRQTLDSQLTENESVKEQIDNLKQDDKPIIFKSIANVLVKQDVLESQSNINRRIEFLKHEQSKVDKKIQSVQANMDRLRPIITELTAKLQQEAAPTQQLAQTHLENPTLSTTAVL